MIDYVKQLLNSKSPASITRFAFILLITNGIAIAWAYVLCRIISAFFKFFGYDMDINFDYVAIISAMFSTATVLKVGQKLAEVKEKNKGADSE